MEALDVETRDGLRRVPLEKARMTIGRLPGNDIVLPFAQISRHHAEVRQRNADWWIIDLSSTNGLRVGGRAVKEYLLRSGDAVTLAPGIIVHFVSPRQAQDIVEGSTVPLPSVVAPVPPGASTPLSARASTLPQPAVAPPHKSAGQIAVAAAVPLPHRRLGFAAPPPAEAPPAASVPPVRPVAPAPPTDDDLASWLNDRPASPPAPASAGWPPAGSAAGTPPANPPAPLPLSSPFALLRQQGATPVAPRRPLLYLCPTCGERTAPDSPYCWSCRSTIAQPCPQCQLYLLPIQSRCPRCETANPQAVRR